MDVWGCSKIVFQKCVTKSNDFLHVAKHILSICGKEDSVLFIQLAHQIWMWRNNWVYQGNFINPNVLMQETTKSMAKFEQVNEQMTHVNVVNSNRHRTR